MSTIQEVPINPLKKERLELQISPEAMASIANIQLAAIGQAEEGFYPNPIPSYTLALGIQPGSPRDKKMREDYEEYQRIKRLSNGPLGVPKLNLNPSFISNENPLLTWRKQSNLAVYGFCSAFCIHMPIINRFEKNITTFTKVPPKQLMEPLIKAGYDQVDGLLEEFAEASQIFKASLLDHIRIINNLPPVGSLAV